MEGDDLRQDLERCESVSVGAGGWGAVAHRSRWVMERMCGFLAVRSELVFLWKRFRNRIITLLRIRVQSM